MANLKHPAFAQPPMAIVWRRRDFGFFTALVISWLVVLWCGRFAYKEALLLEMTKTNGQAVAAWIEQLADRKNMPLTLARCASVVGESPALQGDADWANCRLALFAAGGPFAELTNPFNALNPVIGAKCEKKNPAARGLVTLEKGTPSIPGMPVNVSWEPLSDDQTLVRNMMLRVQVCDAGGYALKIAEVKL